MGVITGFIAGENVSPALSPATCSGYFFTDADSPETAFWHCKSVNSVVYFYTVTEDISSYNIKVSQNSGHYHKNTKRNNCQYPGDGTSCVKPVFSPDSRCSHNTMWSNPQYCSANYPYPGEIRIDQIRKKSKNCNAANNP